MKTSRLSWLVLAGLLFAGCASYPIPPERTAWAESMRHQIVQASPSNYVYIAVDDPQSEEIIEALAFEEGKLTQRIKQDGKTVRCVFMLTQ